MYSPIAPPLFAEFLTNLDRYTITLTGLPKETVNGSLFGELKGSHEGAKEEKHGFFVRADKKILFLL